jgi:hypothetical protein
LILTYSDATGQIVEEVAFPYVLVPGQSIMLLSYRSPSTTPKEVRQQHFDLVTVQFGSVHALPMVS